VSVGLVSGYYRLLLSVVIVTLHRVCAVVTASGCASLEATDEMRVTHSDDGRLAYVECINSRHSWKLHCSGNVWRHVDPETSIASCIEVASPVDDNGGIIIIIIF